MGICNEKAADRTEFIINEHFKIKEKMLDAIKNDLKQKKKDLQTPKITEKANENKDIRIRNSTLQNGKNDKIISKNKSTLRDVYEIKSELGEGGYGKVFKVLHKKMQIYRAMKMISVNSKNEDEKTDEEIELLRQLDHPNIVKLFEYFSEDDKYYLITEYCEGGDLNEKLIKKEKKLSELSAGYIMYQIFRALIYCHNTHHLIHRDIKPDNIVVFRTNNADDDLYDVKLIDFGISKIFKKKNNDNKVKGSPNYIAPEVLQYKIYDEKCDIWSCGVILYILVIGKNPFIGKTREETNNNIMRGAYTFPPGFIDKSSPEIRDLIQQCLKINPSERISAKKALEHNFFNLYQIKEFFIHVTEAFLNKTINNIKKYDIKNSLQELTFTYLVHNYLNKDEISQIHRVFSKFNERNDGKLTKAELTKGLLKYLYKGKKNRDAAEKEAKCIFDKLDGNKNGYIECEEFVRAGIDKKLLKNKKELEFTFEFLDKDKNGEISIEELKEVFGVESAEDEKTLVDLMKSIDTDFNGQISFEEFYNMMLKIIDGLI